MPEWDVRDFDLHEELRYFRDKDHAQRLLFVIASSPISWNGCTCKRIGNVWRRSCRLAYGSCPRHSVNTRSSGICRWRWKEPRNPSSASSMRQRRHAARKQWRNFLKIPLSGVSWRPRRKTMRRSTYRNTGTGSTAGCWNTTRSTVCRCSATNGISGFT